jgi:hypothetical protein
VNIPPRGQISPQGAKFTPRGEVIPWGPGVKLRMALSVARWYIYMGQTKNAIFAARSEKFHKIFRTNIFIYVHIGT